MLADHEMKFAIEDARARQSALLSLILFTDSQAMSLLSLFSAVGVATGSAAATLLSKQPLFPAPVSAGLIVATIVFVIGAYFCLMAMQSVRIGLPGRGPEFWSWANHEKIKAADAFSQYLRDLEVESERNRNSNELSAGLLGKAKLCAVAAPLAALCSGFLTYGFTG